MSVDTTTKAFLREVLADEPSYPKGTVFIDVESDGFVRAVADAMYENRVFVIVFSNDHERAFAPANNRVQRLRARIFWPMAYKALIAEIERAGKPMRRRSRPHKAAPKRFRGAHYTLDSRRTRHRIA
jgi:hypothetical protein